MRRVLVILSIVIVLAAAATVVVRVQAGRAGMSTREFLARLTGGSAAPLEGALQYAVLTPDEIRASPYLEVLSPQPLGEPGAPRPQVPGIEIVDLDQDGRLDVVAADCVANAVIWLRHGEALAFEERRIGSGIEAPVRTSTVDLDLDGDLDVLVASMGVVFPNNNKIGKVVALENKGAGIFDRRVLLENTSRVTDVQAGDLDGDGDLDLSVAQFGYDNGEIRWLRNLGGWQFEAMVLLPLSGGIHAPIFDMDGDGDLDVTALVSQEWEEIYVFENNGSGTFEARRVYGSSNPDFGSSGIALADLNRDGRMDILYTNGDAFDYAPPAPRPWHGVNWLENQGGLQFTFHRVGDFPGAYSPTAADLDKDGDLDLVVVSSFNTWDHPGAISMVWFENDGHLQFRMHPLRLMPTHLLGLAAADMDGNGLVDLVTGGMHAYGPFDPPERMSRVTLWRNRMTTGVSGGDRP